MQKKQIMKSYTRTLFLFIALVLSASAMSQGTTFTVFSEKGENFVIYVNGIQKNSSVADHVVVEGIIGPNFRVRIAFKDNSIHDINKTILNTPNGELYYAIRPGKKGVYVLEKTTSDNVSALEKETSHPTTQPEKKQPKAKSESATKKSVTGCDKPMTEGDFQASTVAISNAPFDGIRLTQAKKLVETHCLYSRQIAEVIHILSNDSSRLTLAKDAYKHCFDPENYNEVKDALSSKKSKQDLEKYIHSAK